MTITYQQAKRIRKTGLLGLFADQLMYEKKVGTALGKAISLKTRGTIMGLTQFMDPLNIAKVLTFGSALGPALLGHFMKRDPRDVQYFTGRLKPIHERTTGEKLTKLSGRGTGTENMDVVLRKMYKLMAATHEQNIKRFEMAKNREEENQMEEERRHKELLDALSSIGGGKVTKAGATQTGDSFLDYLLKNLKPFLEGMVKKAVELALSAYSWLKDIGKWIGRVGGWETAMTAIARVSPALAFLAPWMAVADEREKIRQNPYAPEYKDNPYAMVLRGEYKTEEEAAKANRAKSTGRKIGRTEIQDAVGSELTNNELINVYGADRPTLQKWLIDNTSKSATWQIPVTAKRVEPMSDDGSVDRAEMKKLQRQNDLGMSTPALSEKLDRTQDENLKGRVAYGVLKNTPSMTTINKSNMNQQIDKTVAQKRQIPPVRNQEPTIQELMFSNTRTAN